MTLSLFARSQRSETGHIQAFVVGRHLFSLKILFYLRASVHDKTNTLTASSTDSVHLKQPPIFELSLLGSWRMFGSLTSHYCTTKTLIILARCLGWAESSLDSKSTYAHAHIVVCYMWFLYRFFIGAATCDYQQCGILTSKDSDESVQPPFKLKNAKWCSVSSLTVIEYSSD